MLTTIIFSKDRPLQLDLCLNSVQKNWPKSDVMVLYKCSNGMYNEAYSVLKSEHKGVFFMEQKSSFGELFNDCLNYPNDRLIGFLTDDDIVYEKCISSTDLLWELFDVDKIGCFSYRLGVNITSQSNIQVPRPHFERVKDVLVWNRYGSLVHSYWNYPLSVDGHIFQNSFVQYFWNDLKYKSISTPNKLEVLMQRYFFEIGPIMACEYSSKVVNSPNNRVQEEIKNWYGLKYSIPSEDLAKLYLDGKRCDLEKLNLSVVTPHQEVNLLEAIS